MKPQDKSFLREYGTALLRTPQIFMRVAFRRRTLEEELQEALLRGSLRKAFEGFDVLMLGLGIVIGSGWALLSGTAALYAGPAVIMSYLFGGLAALLSAACYAELCVEYPVSGGAFSYVLVTFGELAGFVALAGLLLEYALGMAAVARGFSSYLAVLINQPADLFIVEVNGGAHSFDFMAAGIILLMSVLLSLGVRESAFFITSVTVVKLVLLLLVAVVGFTQGRASNMTPFVDPVYEIDGVFIGAALLFFSYTGFDAVGNAAEEVRNVDHLPYALVGTALVSMVMYLLVALALALMVPPNISCPAPQFLENGVLTFVSAFKGHGLDWMKYIVSVTALSGIMTSLMVGMFSVSRMVMVASRDWLLPPSLARISPRTQTPLLAQMVFGVLIALLAMLVEVETATALVSFGTLVSLFLVCNAQMYRRYFPEVQLRFTRYGTVETAPKAQVNSWVPGRKLSLQTRKVLVWVHLVAVNVICIVLAFYYQATTVYLPSEKNEDTVFDAASASCKPVVKDQHHGLRPVWFLLAWLLVTLSFQLCCPLEYQPAGWHVPWWLMPWLPSAANLLIVFSVGALQTSDYWKIGSYFFVVLLVYLLYSLPMSYIKHSRVDYVNTEELNVVELAYVNGQWQPKRLVPVYPLSLTSASSSELKVDPSGNAVSSSGGRSSAGIPGPGSGSAAGSLPARLGRFARLISSIARQTAASEAQQ